MKNQDTDSFFASIRTVADTLRTHSEKGEFIRLISHLDADGLSAASIMSQVLYRIGALFRIRVVKQIEEELVETLVSEGESLVVFIDLGSGSLDLIKAKLQKPEIIVLDHHQPIDIVMPRLFHVNPHLYGFDGSQEISGSGVAYLTAKAIDSSNIDLASLAVVGALGDSQDQEKGRGLVGLNATIVEDAVETGLMKVDKDLIFYGRETRPIHKALAYTTEPYIPGLSGEEDKCYGFLTNLGISLKDHDRWRAINDLGTEEKQMIFSEIAKHLSSKGIPNSIALRCIGTVYTLTQEERWSPLRDAREYATFLNACGRTKRGGLGVVIGIGNRGKALDEAQEVYANYKKMLSEAINWLMRSPGSIMKLENVCIVNGSGVIDELIIGTITSILTNGGYLNGVMPILAYTSAENGMMKVSGRVPNGLERGILNLGTIFQKASTRFNGQGGGHDVAAGAYVPQESINEFIQFVDASVGSSLKVNVNN